MSERAVSDPSEHGWVEVDGKWVWGASGGSGDGSGAGAVLPELIIHLESQLLEITVT